MSDSKNTRRQFLSSTGITLSAGWVTLNMPVLLAAQADFKSGAAYQNISAEQAIELGAFADQIISPDDSPGAVEIGVVYFMDGAMGTFMAGTKPMVESGLADWHQKAQAMNPNVERFSQLSKSEQTELLKDEEQSALFGLLHSMVLFGVFSDPSYGGNRDEAGWKLLGFDKNTSGTRHLAITMLKPWVRPSMQEGTMSEEAVSENSIREKSMSDSPKKAAFSKVTFPTRQEVDFVTIGSGAAGGVIAKELSTQGFDVVVLEQGEYRTAADFSHDELAVTIQNELMNHPGWNDPQTFRASDKEVAQQPQQGPPPALYARGVGGSSVHFTANYGRFHQSDFKERSMLGAMEGTGFADWPVSYEELEPYYTKVEWECGVSGQVGPFEAPRSKPYPMPPLPVKSSGVLLEKGAKAIGLHPQPAPMAILSQSFNGRPACMHCGFCMGYGCEANAKSSTLASMIPIAEASGHCEIRPLSTVFKIETNDKGRVTEVLYLDSQGQQQAQKAKAVVLAANGAETPRLLFLSESDLFPDGLANSSGLVGKYLMGNGHSSTNAIFEHPLNEFKSVQVSRIVHDFYENDTARGFYGGGGIDARPFLDATPILYSIMGLPPDAPWWGAEYKKMLSYYYTRKMSVLGSTTSIPLERNNITLDPKLKDEKGRPAIRMTYLDHDDDLAMATFLQDRAVEIMEAAGAQKIWRDPVEGATVQAHLLGTCRMGNDPAISVVDKYHRAHDVPNLFICDGSSFVSSGRGQLTMTIQALAFRAAEHIGGFARRGEI